MARKSNYTKQDYSIDKRKMSNGETVVTVIRADGTKKTLFNPAQKGRKYAKELKSKSDSFTGEKLSKTQLAYRSGYMKSRSDSAKAWKSKNPHALRSGQQGPVYKQTRAKKK